MEEGGRERSVGIVHLVLPLMWRVWQCQSNSQIWQRKWQRQILAGHLLKHWNLFWAYYYQILTMTAYLIQHQTNTVSAFVCTWCLIQRHQANTVGAFECLGYVGLCLIQTSGDRPIIVKVSQCKLIYNIKRNATFTTNVVQYLYNIFQNDVV